MLPLNNSLCLASEGRHISPGMFSLSCTEWVTHRAEEALPDLEVLENATDWKARVRLSADCRKGSPSQLTLLVSSLPYTFSPGASGKETGAPTEAVVRLRTIRWPWHPRPQGCPSFLQWFHFNASALVDFPPGVQWVFWAAGFGLSCRGPGKLMCVPVFVQGEEWACCWLNRVPQKNMLKYSPPVLVNVRLTGNKAFEDVISLRSI